MDDITINILIENAKVAEKAGNYKEAAFNINQLVTAGVTLEEPIRLKFELFMKKQLPRLPETWAATSLKEAFTNIRLRRKQRQQVMKIVKEYTFLLTTYILPTKCQRPNDKVYYFRLLGDLNRYSWGWQSPAPFSQWKKKKLLKIEKRASTYYQEAWQTSFLLMENDPVRLNFYINYSLWILQSSDSRTQASDLLKFSLNALRTTNCSEEFCKKEVKAMKDNVKKWNSNKEWEYTTSEAPKVKMILIINVIKFDLETSYRAGAEADTVRMSTTFSRRNYSIHPPDFHTKQYWSKDDILLQIAIFKAECIRQSAVSSVIYLASHGAEPGIYSSDNKLVSKFEIVSGIQDMEGNVCGGYTITPTVLIWEACRDPIDETYLTKSSKFAPKGNPYTNIVILYSTRYGMPSKRNKVTGGYLSKAISNILHELDPDDDIPVEEFLAKALANLKTIKEQQGDVNHMTRDYPLNSAFVL